VEFQTVTKWAATTICAHCNICRTANVIATHECSWPEEGRRCGGPLERASYCWNLHGL